MDTNRIGLAIFLLNSGKYRVTSIPKTSGKSSIESMFTIIDIKSTSNDFTPTDKLGINEAQKRKPKGVIINAANDDQAVSVTERATLPRAICV